MSLASYRAAPPRDTLPVDSASINLAGVGKGSISVEPLKDREGVSDFSKSRNRDFVIRGKCHPTQYLRFGDAKRWSDGVRKAQA